MDELIFGLRVTIVGLGVVFLALSTVFVTLTLFIRLEQRFISKRMDNLPTPEHTSPATDEAIPPEIIAAIAAAATVAIGKKVRLKRVRYHAAKPATTWSTQGRVSIMASHVTKH